MNNIYVGSRFIGLLCIILKDITVNSFISTIIDRNNWHQRLEFTHETTYTFIDSGDKFMP